MMSDYRAGAVVSEFAHVHHPTVGCLLDHHAHPQPHWLRGALRVLPIPSRVQARLPPRANHKPDVGKARHLGLSARH